VLVQPFDLRIDGSRADASSDEKIAAAAQLLGRHPHELRRMAERSGEIGEGIADLQGADLARRNADGLRDDGHAAGLSVEVGDREGHALAALVGAYDDELSGQGRPGDAGRPDFHKPDARCQTPFFENGKHIVWG